MPNFWILVPRGINPTFLSDCEQRRRLRASEVAPKWKTYPEALLQDWIPAHSRWRGWKNHRWGHHHRNFSWPYKNYWLCLSMAQQWSRWKKGSSWLFTNTSFLLDWMAICRFLTLSRNQPRSQPSSIALLNSKLLPSYVHTRCYWQDDSGDKRPSQSCDWNYCWWTLSFHFSNSHDPHTHRHRN